MATPSSTPAPRSTIADVATAAGVSVPTVSKVLNGRAHVSQETRDRVNTAVEELGYNKRKTQVNGARLLQLVVNNFDSPWVLEILKGTEAAAARQGYNVLCTKTEHVSSEEWRKLRRSSTNQLAGVILLAPHRGSRLVTALRSLNIPAVALDPQGNEGLAIPSVIPASFSGAMLAVEHLLKLGHRGIGIITGGGADSVHSPARYAAYAAALRSAGIELNPDFVRDGDFSIEAGLRLGGELLDLDPRPTAVFAGNDLQALGLMSAATARSIKVPQELSVVGFDDIAQAALTSPPLTTIRQPAEQMGGLAVGMLVDQIENATAGPRSIELATELIQRGSAAPHPQPS